VNGPIMYAWLVAFDFEIAGVGSTKGRFMWTGVQWKLSMVTYYDQNGRFMRTSPASDIRVITRRHLSEKAFEVFGSPYSEQWQAMLRRDGLPIIRLGADPTR